jgi:hypothetical protein
MSQELLDGISQRLFAEKDHSLKAFGFNGAVKSLNPCV